jgi:hypothetical protein
MKLEALQMNFDQEFNSTFNTSSKSGLFKATKIGQYPYDIDEPKTRFDINTNVDYEENIVSEAIGIICEPNGVAYLFFPWQVDAIYNFFNSISEDMLTIQSVFSKRDRPDYYVIRKARKFTKEEMKKIKEMDLSVAV